MADGSPLPFAEEQSEAKISGNTTAAESVEPECV